MMVLVCIIEERVKNLYNTYQIHHQRNLKPLLSFLSYVFYSFLYNTYQIHHQRNLKPLLSFLSYESKKHKIRKTKEASNSSDDGSGMYYRGKSKKHKIRKTKEASDSSDDGSGILSSIIHTRTIIRGI
jgi:hypothetical protein